MSSFSCVHAGDDDMTGHSNKLASASACDQFWWAHWLFLDLVSFYIQVATVGSKRLWNTNDIMLTFSCWVDGRMLVCDVPQGIGHHLKTQRQKDLYKSQTRYRKCCLAIGTRTNVWAYPFPSFFKHVVPQHRTPADATCTELDEAPLLVVRPYARDRTSSQDLLLHNCSPCLVCYFFICIYLMELESVC